MELLPGPPLEPVEVGGGVTWGEPVTPPTSPVALVVVLGTDVVALVEAVDVDGVLDVDVDVSGVVEVVVFVEVVLEVDEVVLEVEPVLDVLDVLEEEVLEEEVLDVVVVSS